jgi:tRNA 5-methylaminomethyl-2-thiouridine biosynthesis bifunctional protein
MNQKYDIAVIGAGIAGASIAYYASHRGLKVLLVDSGKIAGAASGNPAGILYPYMASDYDTATAFYLQGLAQTISLLGLLDSKQKLHQLCGMLHLPKNPHDEQELQRLQELSQKLQLPNEILHSHESGFFMPASGYVNVPAFCEKMIESASVQLLENCHIASVIFENGWRLDAENQSFYAENIVLCNAHLAAELLPDYVLPMRTIRGQISYLPSEILNYAKKYVLCYGGYLTPEINGIHYLGATFEKERTDLLVDRAGHAENINKLQTYFPDMLREVDFEKLQGRAAFRTVSGDRLPIIGQLYQPKYLNEYLTENQYSRQVASNMIIPKAQGLYVNLAHGARGLVSSPLAALKIVNDIACGVKIFNNEMDKLFAPERFILRKWRKKED